MSKTGNASALIVTTLILAATAMATIVAVKKHVKQACHDIRIAMDGSYGAIVETGGLNREHELTIYQERNRKHIPVEKIIVAHEVNKEGKDTYVGNNVKLVFHDKLQTSTGRQIASLQGEVNGEKISATLSCTK